MVRFPNLPFFAKNEQQTTKRHNPNKKHVAAAPEIDVTVGDLARIMSCHRDHVVDHLERHYGGIDGLCQMLHTSSEGLSTNSLHIQFRKEAFGANVIEFQPLRSLRMLILDVAQDVAFIAVLCTTLTLTIVQLYRDDFIDLEDQAFYEPYSRQNYIEGVTLYGVAFFTAAAIALVDYVKGRLLSSSQRTVSSRCVRIVRKAQVMSIDAADLVVGDVVVLSGDDVVLADGVLLYGNDIEVDESATVAAHFVASDTDEELHDDYHHHQLQNKDVTIVKKSCEKDPIILACSHVVGGSGRMLVLAVGANTQSTMSFTGKFAAVGTRATLRDSQLRKLLRKSLTSIGEVSRVDGAETDQQLILDQNARIYDADFESSSHRERSVLQAKVMKMGLHLNTLGVTSGLLAMLSLLVWFCIKTYVGHHKRNQPFTIITLESLIKLAVDSCIVLVFVIPEGLPLVATTALAFSLRRMTKDNLHVRHLQACEAMASVSTIIVDKTGFLTTNQMTVKEAFISPVHYLNEKLSTIREMGAHAVQQLIGECIAINSSETSKTTTLKDKNHGVMERFGNQTECALLTFLSAYLNIDGEMLRANFDKKALLKVYTYDTARKAMATVVDLPEQQRVRCYVKGAPEVLLPLCKFMYGTSASVRTIAKDDDDMLSKVVDNMANDGLRTIVLAYRDVLYTNSTERAVNEQYIASANQPDAAWFQSEERLFFNLTLLAAVGIDDPVRPGALAAVRQCQKAGITVRMVAGGNWLAARSVALKCGIIEPNSDDIIIKGTEFTQIIRDEDNEIDLEMFDVLWPRLRVLARATPTDKFTLINLLMETKLNGGRQVVAATGYNKNDGPSLKRADVGLAVGNAGTDLAKEKSDIIVADDDFSTIIKAVQWGRHIYDSISRYVQFQSCAILTALTIKLVCEIGNMQTPLRTCSFIWLYVIIDPLAAVAFTSELPPSINSLQRKPYRHSRPLITRTMLKNIIGQSLYQLVVVFVLLGMGQKFFDFASLSEEYLLEHNSLTDETDTFVYWAPKLHVTFVANVFMCLTFGNQLNSRKVHGERNVFSGMHRSRCFIVVWLVQWALQFAFVQSGGWWGFAVETKPLSLSLWLWSLVFAVGGLVWQQILLCIPTQKLLPKWCVLGKNVPERDHALDGMLRETGGVNMQDSIAAAHSGDAAVHGQPVLWMRSMARMHSQFQNIQILERNMARSYRLPRLYALPNRYRDRVSYLDEEHQYGNRPRPMTSGTES